jgi:hypothetical protein
MTSEFLDGKNQQMQFISGAPKGEGRQNNDSIDEMRGFFEKPLDNEYEKDAGGFQRLVQKGAPLSQIPDDSKEGDDESRNNSSRSGAFNPLA